MRIALLAHAGSVHTIRWCQGLAGRGHDIHLISHSRPEPFAPNVPIDYVTSSAPLSYLLTIPRLRKVLKSFRPDIVHAHYATGYGLWGTAQKAAPLVLSLWGTDIEDALNKKLTAAPVVRRAIKAARFVTAPSQFLLDRAAAFEPSALPRMRMIPFGVPIPALLPPRQHQEPDRNVKLIFAKSCHPHYAPDVVLRGFAEALCTFPRMELLMLGQGPIRGEMEQLAASLGIAKSVTFAGRVSLDESVRLIGDSDIMLMPSAKEGFGVAAVEAAAAGVPVIASRVGGIPEVVADELSGILITPGDISALSSAIVRLASDPALRQRMGAAGRKIAEEKFDFDHGIDAMEKLYLEVLDRA